MLMGDSTPLHTMGSAQVFVETAVLTALITFYSTPLKDVDVIIGCEDVKHLGLVIDFASGYS